MCIPVASSVLSCQSSLKEKGCGEPTHLYDVLCLCADRRPPGSGSCLPQCGRSRRLEHPANSHDARHSFPLLIFQLPLRPQSSPTTTQARICRGHESQSGGGANEGVYLLFILEFLPKTVLLSFEFFYTAACQDNNACSSFLVLKAYSTDSRKIAHKSTLIYIKLFLICPRKNTLIIMIWQFFFCTQACCVIQEICVSCWGLKSGAILYSSVQVTVLV